MKRIFSIFAFIFLFSVFAVAQNITEYGNSSELKSISKIYVSLVYGGSVELKDRERIINEIEKSKKKNKISNLEIVDRAEDADAILIYSEESENRVTGAITNNIGNTPVTTVARRKVWSGKGIVLKPLSNGNGRLIFDYTGESDFPAKSFGQAFMKAYITANKNK